MPSRAAIPIVSTHEYGPIVLPPALDTAQTRERLETAGIRAGLSVFETRNRRLYARGVVGVIDIGDLIVEILPKTRDDDSPADGVAFLGNLLAFTGGNDSFGLTEAGIASGDDGLLEVILEWAARTISFNLRDGVPRRYTERVEASTAVRGRVELRHLVRQRPGRAFELTVRHAPLSEDNSVSRVVRWLVGEIGQRTRRVRTRALCLKLLQLLSHVAPLTPNKTDVERLTLGSMEMLWSPIIGLASMFLAQEQPNPTRGGRFPAIAILFTLHDLFEAALRRVLSEGLHVHELALQRNSGQLLHSTVGGLGFLKLRPDFRIGSSSWAPAKIVGDAKWKRLFDGSKPLNLRESDVYQVATYMAALRAEAGFIISPLLESESEPLRRSTFTTAGLNRPLDILGVQLASLVAPNPDSIDLRRRLCGIIAGASAWEAPTADQVAMRL
ncbi:hypothetical protein GOB20_09130 [Sinorhizobium meliloti]|nr:hypothetical protein [Sinorhizobium meliloti]